MIYFAIIFSSIAVVAFAIFLGVLLNRKRYVSFVSKNSLRLQSLKKINAEFAFFPCDNLDQSYMYDNEHSFETVRCEDFLIYQLQFLSANMLEQIERTNRNETEYRKYIGRIEALQAGIFSAPVGNLKRRKLLKIEERLCREAQLAKPTTQFFVEVTLYCAKLNGVVYASKRETFSSDAISALVKRVANKYGTFYRDREIWDAICRVERGKVSNKMRFAIYERDGYRCRNCGISQRDAVLEIDHIIPISKGGKSTFDNLQTLCHRCNTEKGNK